MDASASAGAVVWGGPAGPGPLVDQSTQSRLFVCLSKINPTFFLFFFRGSL